MEFSLKQSPVVLLQLHWEHRDVELFGWHDKNFVESNFVGQILGPRPTHILVLDMHIGDAHGVTSGIVDEGVQGGDVQVADLLSGSGRMEKFGRTGSACEKNRTNFRIGENNNQPPKKPSRIWIGPSSK